jgi:phospholipase/carboxylesterase
MRYSERSRRSVRSVCGRPIAGLLFIAAFACCNASRPGEPSTEGAKKPTSAPGAPHVSLDYVEVTTGRIHGNEPAPLIVALHGLGDTPEQFIGIFEGFPADARIVAPHSRTRYSTGWEWFPRTNAPTSDTTTPEFPNMADEIGTFVDEMSKARPTIGKPILMGFSQGGAMTLAVAVRHSGSVAAAFPIGAWLPPPLWPTTLPHDAPPIFAFHGIADERVPIAKARDVAARLSGLGFVVNLQEFEGVGHGIPREIQHALWDGLALECAKARGLR